MKIEDARGHCLEFPHPPRRIVSLVPSITETLFALGSGDRVVGVTDYCVHPAAEVSSRTRVGGTKNPRIDRVLALAPDLVIANREENRRRDVERIEAVGVPVCVTYARRVEEALEEIAMIGRLLGQGGAAASIVAEVESAREHARVHSGTTRPRVVALVWKRPYMSINADTFAHDLLGESGGVNPFAEHERRYPRITEQELEEARPDVILLPTEPYAFGEKDRQELLSLRSPAAEQGRIHVVEGELLSWHGPRMSRALRTFSALLHPR
jgi:ABC-type Fe3+-hydroxamate transport system substrate-binding protein